MVYKYTREADAHLIVNIVMTALLLIIEREDLKKKKSIFLKKKKYFFKNIHSFLKFCISIIAFTINRFCCCCY